MYISVVVDKASFLSEAQKIFKEYQGLETQEILKKMEEIYNYAVGDKKVDDRAKELVESTLEILFKLPSTYVIPYSFIKSPVGRVLFMVLFGSNEKYYSSNDVTAIIGKTRSLISHDLKQGLLVADQYGGRKNIFIYESDLKTYMISKGMEKREAELRISLFKEYQRKGLDHKKINQLIEEQIGKQD